MINKDIRVIRFRRITEVGLIDDWTNFLKMTEIKMNLGDGFTKRKQIQNSIQSWLGRLRLTGEESVSFFVKNLEDGEDKAVTGSKRSFKRTFTTEECLENLKELIEEDRKLALRISLTNQQAKANMTDLEGNEVELTIPELIVLKNEIAPKLLDLERSIPQRKEEGREILKSEPDHIVGRTIVAKVKKSRNISDKGLQQDVEELLGYHITITTDYGYTHRQLYDRIDKLQEWEHRIKEAINQANKTSLIDL